MTKSSTDNKRVNKLVVRIIVAYLLLFIIYLVKTRKPDYFTSDKTTGIVTEVQKMQQIDNGKFYIKQMPVIHFKTRTDSVDFIYSDDEYLSKFEVGDKVQIVYKGEDAVRQQYLL